MVRIVLCRARRRTFVLGSTRFRSDLIGLQFFFALSCSPGEGIHSRSSASSALKFPFSCCRFVKDSSADIRRSVSRSDFILIYSENRYPKVLATFGSSSPRRTWLIVSSRNFL